MTRLGGFQVSSKANGNGREHAREGFPGPVTSLAVRVLPFVYFRLPTRRFLLLCQRSPNTPNPMYCTQPPPPVRACIFSNTSCNPPPDATCQSHAVICHFHTLLPTEYVIRDMRASILYCTYPASSGRERGEGCWSDHWLRGLECWKDLPILDPPLLGHGRMTPTRREVDSLMPLRVSCELGKSAR
jgi:hypothetical protein